MKVLTQNFKSGELKVEECPFPACPAHGALVATTYSAVSLGTERAVYHLAAASPLQKARKRPDLVKQVWNRAKNDGLLNTVSVVRNLVSQPVPMGYSSCGVVLESGYRCEGIEPGDRVACAGFEFANHAEVNAVPRTMMARIPDGVTDEEACFATVASVPLQALRLCDIKSGDTVAILGLGLLGQLCTALAAIQGAQVVGYDRDEKQVIRARRLCPAGRFYWNVKEFAETGGPRGADHTIVCTSAGGRALFQTAGEITRDRGEVVIVGDVQCDIPRRLYYEKELQVKFSRAYGPGRYDHHYEHAGQDYPYGYVRWTMQRNMEEILRLLATQQLGLSSLITHRFPIDEAATRLKPLFEGSGGEALGIVLAYPGFDLSQDQPISLKRGTDTNRAEAPSLEQATASRPDQVAAKSTTPELHVGLIGAGRFAQGILIPAFRKAGIDSFRRIATAGGVSAVSAGRKFGALEAVSRPEDVISDAGANAIVITTQHAQHAALICAGLAAGKHVFCEKPLCLHEEELVRIIAAEHSSAGVFMAGFNRRFSPMLTALKDYMAFSAEPLCLLYRVNAGAQPPDHWVHDEARGGGRIIGECCHYLDVAQFLIGEKPSQVHASSLTGDRADRTYYDSSVITVKYAGGSIATIHFIANGDTSFPKEYLEVHRADSSAVLQNYRSLTGKGPQGRLRKRAFSQQKGFVEEAKAFLTGCQTGVAPIAMADMVTVTRLTFAAMQSLQTGEPVDVSEPDGVAG